MKIAQFSYKYFTMKYTFAVFIFIFTFFMHMPLAVSFDIPEKLVYDLTWAGIKAGTATLEIIDEKDSIRIISTARSVDWVSVFYTVDDRIEAKLVKIQQPLLFVGLPQNYRVKIREGRHRRDKEIIFDHEKRKAIFIDHRKGKKNKVDIHVNTFDPLSSFYYIRTLNIKAGESVFVNMFDNKKMWEIEVRILRKEKIRTKLGNFDTVVIKPLLRSEGIFNRKGDIYIWLTDDLKRIPVKMQTKVALGSVTATLVGGNY